MEAFCGFVRRLADGFSSVGVNYAFTGALAVSLYGSPRTTTDVDVVAVSGLDVEQSGVCFAACRLRGG